MAHPSKHMIHSLSRSISYSRLSLKALALWPMIISDCDDQGRFLTVPSHVKWTFCPNVGHITIEDIPMILAEFESERMLVIYGVEGQYAQIVNWWKYQRPRWARASVYPPPDGWQDRVNMRQGNDIIQENWHEPGGFSDSGSYSDSVNGSGSGSTRETTVVGQPSSDSHSRRPYSAIFTEVTGILIGSAIQAEEIDAWMEDVPEEWFRAACKEAVDHNARKWAYVRAVLERSKEEGKMPGTGDKPADFQEGSEKFVTGKYAEYIRR